MFRHQRGQKCRPLRRVVHPRHGAALARHVVVPQHVVGVDAIALHDLPRQRRGVCHGLRQDVVAAVGALAAAHLDADAVAVAALGVPVRPRAAVPRRVALAHGLHRAVLVHEIVCACLQAAHAVVVIAVVARSVTVVCRVVHHNVPHRLRAPGAVI